MEWEFAIERQREALKGVLAALLAMAGLAASAGSSPPLVGFGAVLRLREAIVPAARWQAEKAGTLPQAAGTRQEDGSARRGAAEALAEPGEGCARPTLPRHLHRAVLRLLRPAEAAARRLVIAAARGLVVTLPSARPRKPKPKQPAFRPGTVTGIWTPPQFGPQAARLLSDSGRARPLRLRALPLFDPLRPMRQAKRKAKGVPRIRLASWGALAPLPFERPSKGRRPPSPDDPIDAARLALRLAAVARALDDLDGHARRFARWRAARDAAGARNENRDAAGAQNENRDAAGAQDENRDAARSQSGGAGRDGTRRPSPRRARRVWPLKPGRPPGLASPLSGSRRADHAVHEILRDAHALALGALERPDTS